MANEVQKYQKDISPYINKANALAVRSTEDVEAARDFIRDIKDQIKAVKEFFDPRIDQANKLHKGLIADRGVFEVPLKGAQSVIEQKIGVYVAAEQKKLREEAQRREDEERRKHEQAVARAAKSMDALLEKAGEFQEQITALEAELERPDITTEESLAAASRLEMVRAKLDASERKVAVVTERATVAYIPPPPPVVEKVAGVTVKKVLEPVILNAAIVINAISQGQAPADIVDFNMDKIKKLINAGIKIPGVGSTESHKTAVR